MNLFLKIKNVLFWQPKTDWYKKIFDLKYGKQFLLATNYIIWFFLFYASYLLIRKENNIFWQLLIATIIGEIIEKVLKKKSFWTRPLHLRKNVVPDGMLKSWYKEGSFPSGHSMKAMFFLFFILQYPISISPQEFLIVVLPLIFLRVFLGLHYIIDLLGGFFFGIIIWFCVRSIVFPEALTQIFAQVFNFVFFIK